jgi:hypothetical protein
MVHVHVDDPQAAPESTVALAGFVVQPVSDNPMRPWRSPPIRTGTTSASSNRPSTGPNRHSQCIPHRESVVSAVPRC